MTKRTFYYTEFFKKIANQQKVLLNKGASSFGLTYVQSMVIVYLQSMRAQFGADYEISQKGLEQYLSLKGSTIAHVLDRLEENGLLKRVKSSKDSRANHLLLTEKGDAFIPLFFDVLDDVEEQMTKGMTDTEKQQLQKMLQKVFRNLEEM